MKKKSLYSLLIAGLATSVILTGCGSASTNQSQSGSKAVSGEKKEQVSSGALNEYKLDDYKPKKTEYYFAFTYKLIHPWYDTIKVGAEAAVADYAKKGIKIKFDYEAPATPDAIDQVNRIENAVSRHPDVIGVDVTQIKTVVPVMNKVVEGGIPVMTFSGDDATKEQGAKRIAFVGNNQNKEDGAILAEELAKAINYEGEVAALDGTIGAPSHEERIEGFNEVMKKYPKIKVVDRQRDNDDLQKSIQITESFIQKHPNLKGIWANNMTNPIGAAQAVVAAGKKGKITIVGMDHDLRTLNYVKDGTIKVARIQDCFGMGYHLIDEAVKIADGEKPGGEWIKEEINNLPSINVTQDDAQKYIDLLYGKK
ncbi:substrate-binding domain-containing protein [Neobacillus sp. MM2021_6]|uniref:substrate-binding domain-containing protein n=1 Tax=Bacillaceae TaxID=186817 RepID=UPI00140E8414|nr:MULTISPECIES: substrate-binding domain-containing protein [Bacillaceae]MBO0958665.1 substrate-binding domain-containing protein [Neobacillus sp. MM2021_6]NHC20195.1 substrate-binding domain-containing protein [Bacillus sp. MM2020_4]